MNTIYKIIKVIQPLYICLFEPIKRMSTSLSSVSNTILFYMRKDKNSNENMLKPMEVKSFLKRRESISNLNNFVDVCEEKKNEYLFDINNRLPFVKNKNSKIELNSRIEYIEKNMCTKCMYCNKTVKNECDIYLLMDNFYCSELCRRQSLHH